MIASSAVKRVSNNPPLASKQEEYKIVSSVSGLLDDKAAYEKMSKAVNPYGDGLACGRIVERFM